MRILLILLFLMSAVLVKADENLYRYVYPSDVKYDISVTEASKGINKITGLPAMTFQDGGSFGTDAFGDYLLFQSNKFHHITYTASSEINASDVWTLQIKYSVTKPIPNFCCPILVYQFPWSSADSMAFQLRAGFEGSADYGEFEWSQGYPPGSIRIDDAVDYGTIQTAQFTGRRNPDSGNLRTKLFYKNGEGTEYKQGFNWNATNSMNDKILVFGDNVGLNGSVIKYYQILISIGKDYNQTEILPSAVPRMLYTPKTDMKYYDKDDMQYAQ